MILGFGVCQFLSRIRFLLGPAKKGSQNFDQGLREQS